MQTNSMMRNFEAKIINAKQRIARIKSNIN